MKLKIIMVLAGLSAGGCATVTSESMRTIVVDGRSYELHTSVIEGTNGPYERSRVVVNNKLYICLPDSRGDCEAAVRGARDENNRRG